MGIPSKPDGRYTYTDAELANSPYGSGGDLQNTTRSLKDDGSGQVLTRGQVEGRNRTSLLAPDLTDETVKAARLQELSRLMVGRNRKSTFLTGPLGDLTMPQLGKTLLGGSGG